MLRRDYARSPLSRQTLCRKNSAEGCFFVGVAPAVLDRRRSEAPLWEIGVAYDRKSQQVDLIGTAPEKLSYQVVADYDSYQAIPRIAPPIKGVARLLQTP